MLSQWGARAAEATDIYKQVSKPDTQCGKGKNPSEQDFKWFILEDEGAFSHKLFLFLEKIDII